MDHNKLIEIELEMAYLHKALQAPSDYTGATYDLEHQKQQSPEESTLQEKEREQGPEQEETNIEYEESFDISKTKKMGKEKGFSKMTT